MGGASGGGTPLDPAQPTSSPAPIESGSAAPAADELAQLPGPVADHLRARENARSVQQDDPGDGSAASAKSARQTTTPAPAGQPDEVVAKLTPEQRARVLAEADPDEIAKVNDKLNGYVGKRLQVERATQEEQARKQQLLGLRQKALTERDPDAALQALEATTTAELESQHQAAWSDAVGLFTKFDANPLTKPFVNKLAGTDYGQLAGGNGTLASLLYMADQGRSIAEKFDEVVDTIRAEAEQKAEKKLRPIIEREVKARLAGEEPPPDTGTGAPPGGDGLPDTLPELKRFIKTTSLADYQRLEPQIEKKLAALTGGGRNGRR